MRERHGDVVRVSIGPLQMTLVSHPELVESVLVTQNRLWQEGPLPAGLRPVLGDGLLSSEGDFWRRQRRLAQPAFHRDRIAAYGGIMVDHATRLADQWRARRGARRPQGHDAPDARDCRRDALRRPGRRPRGRRGRGARGGAHGRRPTRWRSSCPSSSASRRRSGAASIARSRSSIRSSTASSSSGGGAGRRRPATSCRCCCTRRTTTARGMSDKQLRDECMTLFLAGHETTALNLSWTWLLLSQHPDGRREAGARAPRRPRRSPGDVRRSPEPPLHGARHRRVAPALPARLVDGARGARGRRSRRIPRAARRAGLVLSLVDRSATRAGSTTPDAFRPERWEGDLAKKLPRYAYFPFGGGPRFCIGQAFAQMEAVLLLATLARAFHAEVLPKPASCRSPSVTLRPKHGLRVRLSAR